MANFIFAIAFLFNNALEIYFWIVIISALLSWVRPDPYNPIVRFLRSATEPVYWRIRQYLPFVIVGGMDLSPLVVIFVIKFLQMAVVGNMVDWANAMRYH